MKMPFHLLYRSLLPKANIIILRLTAGSWLDDDEEAEEEERRAESHTCGSQIAWPLKMQLKDDFFP
jgi:hypothetical protein